MNNIEIYQKEINNIFSFLKKLKDNYSNQDNINYINNLEEYKEDAIMFLNLIKEEDSKVGDNSDR